MHACWITPLCARQLPVRRFFGQRMSAVKLLALVTILVAVQAQFECNTHAWSNSFRLAFGMLQTFASAYKIEFGYPFVVPNEQVICQTAPRMSLFFLNVARFF